MSVDHNRSGQEAPQTAVNLRDTPVSAQRPRHGVHRRGCPAPLQMAQGDDRLWPYRPPKGSRSCRELGGGGSMKPSLNFARVSLGDGVNTYSRPSGCTGQPSTLGCQARPPPFAYYSAVTTVLKWALPHLAPTTRAWADYITSLPTRVKTFKCRKFAKTYSTAIGRDASNESTTTQGLDAPLPQPE